MRQLPEQVAHNQGLLGGLLERVQKVQDHLSSQESDSFLANVVAQLKSLLEESQLPVLT